MKTKIVKVDEVKIESLIKKNFSEEFMRKIYDIYSDDCMSIVEKTILFDKIFTEEFGHRKDYRRIGEGTNRFVCLLDNHIIKVAYNYLAYIDNMNELAQAKYKKKYLAQAYETNGIILVSEYVTVMDKEDFLENQSPIFKILNLLEKDTSLAGNKERRYILGDMGMSEKNYGNWGRRMNGDIVVLDYGYLYQLSEAEWKEVSKCPICGSSLKYTSDFSQLICVQNAKHEVQYTTLRNVHGYANIIENIKENLNDDKYVKFDNKGEIVVDVMERVEIEEDDTIKFEMPEDVESRLIKSKSKFYEIIDIINGSGNGMIEIEDYYQIKEEMFNEQNEYDEILFPYTMSALELTYTNMEKYCKEFDKVYKARYDLIYNDLKNEFENNRLEELLKEGNDIPDICDENEEYTVRGYESEVKMVDLFDVDDSRKVTSLDLLLGDAIDDAFNNIIMADDNEALNNIETENEYELDYIMGILNANEKLKEQDEEVVEEKSQEELELDAIENLKETYKKLEDSLTNLITTRYEMLGCKEEREEDYVWGDVYRTYMNGDRVDLEYSPRVNARNILGGWDPDEFAFPLYRHLLNKFNYDMETIELEYEAIYSIDETVEVPTDLYSNVENRSIVVGQILNRFEDEHRPPRHLVISTIGRELTEYYEALDEYYDVVNKSNTNVGTDSPEYYLRLVENTDYISKSLREAKEELKDELLNNNLRLEDLTNEYKIVYDYDIESIMTNTELNVLDLIKSTDFSGVSDIKEHILNQYYMTYDSILPDSVFDVFKYYGSTVKEEGCSTHPRLAKPKLKARLVRKDSKIDSYKPDMFVKNDYHIIVVEQRYEIIINKNDDTTPVSIDDIKLKLKRKNLHYAERSLRKYSVKKSKDNLRYGLTEKEIEILEEYESMLGTVVVKDKDKLFKKYIVDVLDRKHNMSYETKMFMEDLYKHDLTEAFANRLLRINVLELNGQIDRLDYLAQIGC